MPNPSDLLNTGPTNLKVLVLAAPASKSDALYAQTFREAGFECSWETVQSAAEFTTALSGKRFDLILVEGTLLDGSGLEALASLRHKDKDTPVIFLASGLPDKEFRARLEQIGIDFVPQKDLIDFRSRVKGALKIKTLSQDALRLESQLRNAQKMESLGRLAAGVAHDFNNILTVIQGHVGLLKSQRNLTPEMAESLQQVSRATERAAKLTGQLLNFTREHAPRPEPVNLNELLTSLSTLLVRTLGEDITVQFSYAPDLPPIEADRNSIEQMVFDLAVQGRESMPAGGQLVMSTALADIGPSYLADHSEASVGRFVCLSVIDTGGGLEPERLRQIFGAPTEESASSFLAAVDRIVKQHHGWIEAQSRVGQGSTFRIFLPASKTAEKKPARSPNAGQGETVLVIEDEPPVLWITRNILEQHGYRVLEATNGMEALAVWHQHQKQIAVLLVDLIIPVGVTGQELAEQFQREKPGLKVIYTSGYSPGAAAKNLELVHGLNFLQKPFDADRLVHAVEAALAHNNP